MSICRKNQAWEMAFVHAGNPQATVDSRCCPIRRGYYGCYFFDARVRLQWGVVFASDQIAVNGPCRVAMHATSARQCARRASWSRGGRPLRCLYLADLEKSPDQGASELQGSASLGKEFWF